MKKVLFVYNNIGNAYFAVKVFFNNHLKDERVLYFDEEQLENGLPINYEAVASFVKDMSFQQDKITLILNSKETFSLTTRMPKINIDKADKLVKKELNNAYPTLKDDFYTKTVIYQDKINYIFYNYLVPNKLVHYFERIAILAKKKIKTFDMYANYLVNTIDIKDDQFALFLNENENTTIALKFRGGIFASTSVSNINDVRDAYIKLSSKHTYDLEKVEINKIYSNIQIPNMNEFDIKVIEPKYNLNDYSGREV